MFESASFEGKGAVRSFFFKSTWKIYPKRCSHSAKYRSKFIAGSFSKITFSKYSYNRFCLKVLASKEKELWDRFLFKSKWKIYPKRCSDSAKYRSKFIAGSFSKKTFSKNSYTRFCLKVLASREKELWGRFFLKVHGKFTQKDALIQRNIARSL